MGQNFWAPGRLPTTGRIQNIDKGKGDECPTPPDSIPSKLHMFLEEF